MDPIVDPTGEEFSAWPERMLGNMGLYPIYTYVDGKNQMSLRVKKRTEGHPLARMLGAFVLAVAVGLLGGVLPQALTQTLLDNLIGPVYETFMGVLSIIAGPMVFLAVAWASTALGTCLR